MPYSPAQYTSAEVGSGYTITGLRETLDMLENLPKNIVLGGFSKALHAAGSIMEAEVEKRTPIRLEIDGGDLVVSGGALKSDVYHEVTLDSNYRGGVAIVSFRKYSHIANWVEYGHRMIGHKPGKRQLSGPRTPDGMVRPNPFIRPAFEASKDRAIDAFARSIAETVHNYWASGIAA